MTAAELPAMRQQRYLAADQARGTIASCAVEPLLQALLSTLANRLAAANALCSMVAAHGRCQPHRGK
ncbi:MAG: hypothetical protein ABTR92_14465 [Candidatus Accumulibacter phosphatis]|jgi:hypothetical protein|uniref:hypothetical protein n=1 Tax=Candidatus Accumulibacter sp. ACC012 TaxID=2823332 RepID=UPI0025C73B7E|nr:hypothetical protein [Candidatus Accumulibacter sp. ACC012]